MILTLTFELKTSNTKDFAYGSKTYYQLQLFLNQIVDFMIVLIMLNFLLLAAKTNKKTFWV